MVVNWIYLLLVGRELRGRSFQRYQDNVCVGLYAQGYGALLVNFEREGGREGRREGGREGGRDGGRK